MLKAKTPLLVGLLVIVGVVAFLFTFSSLNKGMDEKSAYTVFARFDDVSGLAPGSRVMIAGIEVGRLGKPDLDPENPARALVPMLIKNEVVLHKGLWDEARKTWTNGAMAVRRQASLIGDYDVVLSPGTHGERIPPNGEILNVQSVSGLDALMSEMGKSTDVIMPNLEKITTDIQAVTSALRDSIGGTEGATSISQIRDDIQKTAANVAELTGEMRAFLNNSVYSQGDSLQRIVLNLERTSNELARMSVGSGQQLERILSRVDGVTHDVSRFIKDQTGNGTETKPGTVANVIQGLDRNMGLIEDSLTSVKAVAEDLEAGRGTVGRLLSDDRLINDVERVVSDVGSLTSGLSRLQVGVEFHTDYFVGRESFKSTVAFRLQPAPDKYYLLQLVDDPMGKTDRTLRVTTSNDPRVPPVLVEEISETKNTFKITAQFAKRYGNFTFRYGVMESSGGLGLDVDLLSDSLNFKFDAFEFGRNSYPRFRLLAQWEFIKHLIVTAGIDDMLNGSSRDWFVGLGVRFVDDDLKGILPFVPTP